jgi:hypothetical protein
MMGRPVLDLTTIPHTVAHVGEGVADAPKRSEVLGLLSRVPALIDTVKKLGSSETFRVVMSEKNAHLFKQAADGTWKPVLREGGKIAEHVDLVRMGPEFIGAASNVLLTVNMAAIASKLAAIEAKVDHLGNLTVFTQRSRVQGVLDSLALACALSNPIERRSQMLIACGNVMAEVIATSGQLKSHIMAMPNETTGWFDGIFDTNFEAATAAFKPVREDMQAIADGTSALLTVYAELNEPAVAREALARVVTAVQAAGMDDAIRKARLLPVSKGSIAPEASLKVFAAAVDDVSNRLLSCDSRNELAISVDLRPGELSYEQR